MKLQVTKIKKIQSIDLIAVVQSKYNNKNGKMAFSIPKTKRTALHSTFKFKMCKMASSDVRKERRFSSAYQKKKQNTQNGKQLKKLNNFSHPKMMMQFDGKRKKWRV